MICKRHNVSCALMLRQYLTNGRFDRMIERETIRGPACVRTRWAAMR